MTNLTRTTSDDADFLSLVKLLDEYLAIKDGKEHSFYAQYNKINRIKNVVVYYDNGVAVGCGAFKEYDSKTVEIKRMFVHPDYRSKGIGAIILNELEVWAKELNYISTVLETGKRQPEAIHLYQKSGYKIIPNYGQYKEMDNSVCMMKMI
jgi:GNAT superfamily N-acetyltransferase